MPPPLLEIAFPGEVIYWRGPSPYLFVAVPAEHAGPLREAAREASYGWGMIPVEAVIRDHVFTTSLFPKDGSYLLPIRTKVRDATDIAAGEIVGVSLAVHAR